MREHSFIDYLDVPLNLVVGRSVKVDLKELQFRFLDQCWNIIIKFLILKKLTLVSVSSIR